MRNLTADEGGLAPPCDSSEAMLDLAMESIWNAGFTPGTELSLALDVAASHFFAEGGYQLDGERLGVSGMIRRLTKWADRYPLISIEDGLWEESWEEWPRLHSALGISPLTLGDDFLCTHPERIQRAVQCQACNALLLKVNQIGTLTEAAQSLGLARTRGGP